MVHSFFFLYCFLVFVLFFIYKIFFSENPPIVHVKVSGGCDDLLIDRYEDKRMDQDSTLYHLRMCNPDDGWIES